MAANRRHLLSTAIVVGSGAALNRGTVLAAQDAVQASPTADTVDVGRAGMPDWNFAVRQYIDPYEGDLQFPSGIASNERLIQVEVVITNASDQPLTFKASDVHLVDTEGVEYAAGTASGSAPKLVSQDLPDGERTRGSVWFIVADTAVISEVKFFAPAAQLHVRLDG